MAYRMTAARKRALRKAQLVSARLRKRMGNAKLSKGHKRALAVVVAGAAVAGGAYHTAQVMNATKLASATARRNTARQNVRNRKNARMNAAGDGTSSINELLARARKTNTAGTAPSSTITPGDFAHIIRISNKAPESVKNLLLAQKGSSVTSVYHGGKAVKRKRRVQYGDYEQTGVMDDGSPIWEWKPTSRVL